jgi:2-keto-3-deoxy-6-phosphogluconate aldolase
MTEAETYEMPILCGVLTFKEAKQALLSNANALKFYPATAMNPKLLAKIIDQLKDEGLVSSNKMIDIIVAGGVLNTDFEAYMRAGATGFAIGFDCRKVTPNQIQIKLKDLNEHYKSLKGGLL